MYILVACLCGIVMPYAVIVPVLRIFRSLYRKYIDRAEPLLLVTCPTNYTIFLRSSCVLTDADNPYYLHTNGMLQMIIPIPEALTIPMEIRDNHPEGTCEIIDNHLHITMPVICRNTSITSELYRFCDIIYPFYTEITFVMYEPIPFMELLFLQYPPTDATRTYYIYNVFHAICMLNCNAQRLEYFVPTVSDARTIQKQYALLENTDTYPRCEIP